MIKVTLKDGSVKEFENELSVMDIAKSISEGSFSNSFTDPSFKVTFIIILPP